VTAEDVARDLKASAEYRALPAKVAQGVLRQVALAWTSPFAACQAWQADPTTFLGHPTLPKSLPKSLPKQGRNLLTYTEQAISRAPKNRGSVVPSGVNIRLDTRQTNVDQARLVPRSGCALAALWLRSGCAVVEVIYERAPVPAPGNPARRAGGDRGLNTRALLAADIAGCVPRLVNGRPVKSMTPFYNQRQAEWQRRAEWQRQLDAAGEADTSRRGERLTTKRTRRIDHSLPTASRRLIDLLVAEGIGPLCSGKNPLWKQAVHMGRRGNQNVVCVPHARFMEVLTYNAELVGIQGRITEERATSRAS
jgi:hypothetical protein